MACVYAVSPCVSGHVCVAGHTSAWPRYECCASALGASRQGLWCCGHNRTIMSCTSADEVLAAFRRYGAGFDGCNFSTALTRVAKLASTDTTLHLCDLRTARGSDFAALKDAVLVIDIMLVEPGRCPLSPKPGFTEACYRQLRLVTNCILMCCCLTAYRLKMPAALNAIHCRNG